MDKVKQLERINKIKDSAISGIAILQDVLRQCDAFLAENDVNDRKACIKILHPGQSAAICANRTKRLKVINR